MASSLLLNLWNDCLRSQWRSALERNHRVPLKPVIFGFIVWHRQDSGHVCAVMKVLRSGWRRKVFIAHAAVLMKIPCVLVTLTLCLFDRPSSVNHGVKISASALCCRGKTLAVNQHSVVACSYKKLFFKEGVATSPCQERRGREEVSLFFSSLHEWIGWWTLSSRRSVVVFLGWAVCF